MLSRQALTDVGLALILAIPATAVPATAPRASADQAQAFQATNVVAATPGLKSSRKPSS